MKAYSVTAPYALYTFLLQLAILRPEPIHFFTPFLRMTILCPAARRHKSRG